MGKNGFLSLTLAIVGGCGIVFATDIRISVKQAFFSFPGMSKQLTTPHTH